MVFLLRQGGRISSFCRKFFHFLVGGVRRVDSFFLQNLESFVLVKVFCDVYYPQLWQKLFIYSYILSEFAFSRNLKNYLWKVMWWGRNVDNFKPQKIIINFFCNWLPSATFSSVAFYFYFPLWSWQNSLGDDSLN